MLFVEDFLSDIQLTLQDKDATGYAVEDLVFYLNEALRTIALVKPDATAVTQALALAQDSRQVLPASAVRFIKLTRNVSAAGVPGRPITRADHDALVAVAPDWHTLAPVNVIKNYTFDELDPMVFWVYPPADGTSKAETVFSEEPTKIDTASLNFTTPQVLFPLKTVYQAPAKDWVLGRALGVEVNSRMSQELSVRYGKSFASMLGIKWHIDLFTSPYRSQDKSPDLT